MDVDPHERRSASGGAANDGLRGRGTQGATSRFTLVLGAGGTVGMAFHAGVLRALIDAGVDPADADLVIGTSAGAMMGALVRSGASVDDLWTYAHSGRPEGARAASADERRVLFQRGWQTPLGFARRAAGSGFVVARSVVRWPPLRVPGPVARALRGGMASTTNMRGGDRRLARRGVAAPPAVVVHGRSHDRQAGRARAHRPVSAPARRRGARLVRRPGLYPPVRHGRRVLVDGGADSTTNADLATHGNPGLVILSTPMGCQTTSWRDIPNRVVRGRVNRRLDVELAAVRASGATIIDIRPTAEEARREGLRLIRVGDHARAAAAAYETASATLKAAAAQLAVAG